MATEHYKAIEAFGEEYGWTSPPEVKTFFIAERTLPEVVPEEVEEESESAADKLEKAQSAAKEPVKKFSFRDSVPGDYAREDYTDAEKKWIDEQAKKKGIDKKEIYIISTAPPERRGGK